MVVIGVTGGIGTGKSTVAGMFKQLGAVVLDADVIARQVMEPKRLAWRQIVKAFGAILDNAANLEVADIFTKMWDQEDPSARFIMSQSAPLMIPTNPNCTARVRVVA